MFVRLGLQSCTYHFSYQSFGLDGVCNVPARVHRLQGC